MIPTVINGGYRDHNSAYSPNSIVFATTEYGNGDGNFYVCMVQPLIKEANIYYRGNNNILPNNIIIKTNIMIINK